MGPSESSPEPVLGSAREGSDTARVPSPASTGGAGERFEQHLDAFALALLLARSTAPVLTDGVVVGVDLQTRHLGWCTDDLLISAETRPGVTRRLAIQAKRSFTIAAGDEECVDTIRAMWSDFTSDRFDANRDRLAVVTLHGTSTLLGSFASLLDCARASADALDFSWRLQLKGYLSRKALDQNDALVAILGERLSGGAGDERYWRFLRVISVISVDLGTSTAQTEALIVSLLAHTVRDAADPMAVARETWTALLDVASKGRETASRFRRESLPSAILERHEVVSTADERAVRDLVEHGRVVRDAIRAAIGQGYALDRSAQAATLLEQLDVTRVAIVAGAAGSGKSALAKAVAGRVELEQPVFAFQAVEFATPHINETLAKTQASINAVTLVALLAAHDKTLIVIDGVERLLEHSVRDAFTQLLQLVVRTPALRLLVTCRDYSLETVRSSLLAPSDLVPMVFDVAAVTDEELAAVAQEVPGLRPALDDDRMRSLLRTPYLLDMAARMSWSGETPPRSVRAFRNKCWKDLIRDEAHAAAGMPQRRENVFVDVARKRAAALRPYVQPAVQDPEALDALRAASLLVRSEDSDRLFAPAHDVLEDWAILKWLDDVATDDDPAAALQQATAGLPAVRRSLRRWLGERLETEPDATRQFITNVLERKDLERHFRDDCVVAALLSDFAPTFLEGCRERVASGDVSLLREVVNLLRVACKSTPAWLPAMTLPSNLLVPTGPGWAPTLDLVAGVIDSTEQSDLLLALGLVEDWATQITVTSPPPPGAESAGRIVSTIVPRVDGYGYEKPRERAFQVVLKIPARAPIFNELAKRAIENDPDNHTAREFADLAIGAFTSGIISRDFPDVVCDILRARLLMHERELVNMSSYSWHDVDQYFGIHDRTHLDFFPASSLQGPFRSLLRQHPQKGVAFVLELVNHAGDWYGKQRWPARDLEPAFRIGIDIPDGGRIEQWMNGRMYALYRGVTVGPNVVKAALMALEEWLLSIESFEQVDLESWLLYILRESNNVMATGVVASVCVANPVRAGRAALALLSSRELIQLDTQRMAAEASASLEILPGLNPQHAIFEAERRGANKLPHRREDLETMAVRLQLTERRDEVWRLIDAHRGALTESDDDATLTWRLALHRMDVRGFQRAAAPAGNEAAPDGNKVYYAPGELEPAVQRMVDGARTRLDSLNEHLTMLNAANAAWRDRSTTSWRDLLRDAREIAGPSAPPEPYLAGGPGIVAAMCLRDHRDDLTPDELQWCIASVIDALSVDEARPDLNEHSRSFGPDRAAAAVVAMVVAKVPGLLGEDPLSLLTMAFCHPIREVRDYAYAGAGAFLGGEHAELLIRCAAAAVSEATAREAALNERRSSRSSAGGNRGELEARVRRDVRAALSMSADEARHVVEGVNHESEYGRVAVRHIVKLIENRRDWEFATNFVTSTARALAEAMRDDRDRSTRRQRDFHGEAELARAVARFALRSTTEVAVSLFSTEAH